MKKLALAVVFVLLTMGSAYGAAIDNCVEGYTMRTSDAPAGNYITANTVSFSTVSYTSTFASPIRKITIINESSASDLHCTIGETTGVLQRNDTVGHTIRLSPLSSITLETKCSAISFVTNYPNSVTNSVQFVATGYNGQP